LNTRLNQITNGAINVAAFIILRLLHATYRYRVFGMNHRIAAQSASPGGAVAMATWHGFSVAGTLAHTGQNVRPLCSQSKDGSMVAFVCRMMGMRPIRGSSSRGGKEARDEILAGIPDGYSVGITVDGPKGPSHIVKPGIIDVARKGSIAILPLTAMADRNWVLRSWDRLHIPKPFSKIAVLYGSPIFVDPNADGDVFEAARLQVQNRLLTQDSECGAILRGHERAAVNWQLNKSEHNH